jgi:hypothetical protein
MDAYMYMCFCAHLEVNTLNMEMIEKYGKSIGNKN